MLLNHFKLREQPFGVTPDPSYLFASETHREALASLLYGLEAGLGFVALIAKPGMGKTTLLFETLRRMESKAKLVFLFQAIHTPTDLVRALLLELGVRDLTRTIVELQTQLNALLVAHAATGKRLIVVIDEAQNLSEPVLEAVRMLSNFETSRHKLIQVVLSGQPQLDEKLALPAMLQLRQRISIFGRLSPLSLPETKDYITYRLSVAGRDPATPLFTRSALDVIAWCSEGIPRNINNICFNALSLACALQCNKIDTSVIDEVACDLGLTDLDNTAGVARRLDQDRGDTANSKPSVKRPASKLQILPPLTAICAMAVLVAGPFVPNHDRGLSLNSTVHAGSTLLSSATSPRDEIKPPLRDPQLGSVDVQSAQVRSITVRKGQTLSRICAENFAECPPQRLREIVSMNTSIADPDHILTGQNISIPSLSLLPPHSLSIGEQETR